MGDVPFADVTPAGRSCRSVQALAMHGLTILLTLTLPLAAPATVLDDHAEKVAAQKAAVASTFAELSQRLRAGQHVRVTRTDVDGSRLSATVVSVSASQLVLDERRRFRRSRRLTLDAGSVSRITAIDSTADGALLGAAPGIVATFAMCRRDDTSGLCGIRGLFATVVGLLAGGTIDSFLNRDVFHDPASGPTTALLVISGPSRFGIGARIGF